MSTEAGRPGSSSPLSPQDGSATREQRATRAAAIAFFVAILAGVVLVYVYAVGGNTVVEGVLLFLAFGGVGVGITVWVKFLLHEPDVSEERPPMRSPGDEREAFDKVLDELLARPSPASEGRRRFLARLLAGASASLALALLLPFRSLGPGTGRELFETAWEDGSRLVGFDGNPIRPDTLREGGIVTVFPEGHIGSTDAQAVLIRVEVSRLRLPEDAPPTVEGLVCFSKLCTHAGCPVGLYRAAVGQLLCPCHQSLFDVFRGARPISGPTTRPLPMLPLGVDAAGFLVALGDFPEPVGASFWNMELQS